MTLLIWSERFSAASVGAFSTMERAPNEDDEAVCPNAETAVSFLFLF